MRLRTLAFLLAALAALTPTVAGACAALFSPEDAEVRQRGQWIIFAVDRVAGTVEAYVSVSYTGAAEEFAWIVPLPSQPTLEVIRPAAFTALESATRPRFLLPENNCFELQLGGGSARSGAPGGVQVFEQGQVGPYDFAVIGGEQGGQLADWLRQNGYRVTPPMEPLIQSYADAGMRFLAMKLQPDQTTAAIAPIKMTFAADAAMVPLRLAAVGAEPDTELRVWVFADRQVVPENMTRLTIEDAQVGVTDVRGGNNYRALVDETLGAAAGRGLLTESAEPTGALPALDDPLITELRGRFGYVTRFYGRFDPEQMTVDPRFAPADGLADIPAVRDLRERVSPYRCLEREVLPVSEQATSPLSPAGLWVAYGWIVWCLAVPAVLALGVALMLRRRRRASR
jgi:hypothetical protein